jgi:hypothetical protein
LRCLFSFSLFPLGFAQNNIENGKNLSNTFIEENISIDQYTDGTLTLPADSVQASHLVVFIQGSGPTNRDGNQPMAEE